MSKTTNKKTTALIEQPETQEASVGSFILKAIENNLPVETMERLFALREKMKAEQAREAFTEAMSKFQAECPVIEKTKKVFNKDGRTVRYSYAPLDSIVSQVQAPLGKYGLSHSIETLNEEGFLTAICKITHSLGHSESSAFKVPIDKDGYMTEPQKYASALTFAKRYAFCNALGILTGDEDTDTDDVVAKPTSVQPDTYRLRLEAVKNMEELQMVWASLPVEAKVQLEAVKNQLKTKYADTKVQG